MECGTGSTREGIEDEKENTLIEREKALIERDKALVEREKSVGRKRKATCERPAIPRRPSVAGQYAGCRTAKS